MTGRSMTDAQLAAALRAHLPAQAHAGLRDRISAEIAETRQATRLSWLFSLGSEDPGARRRGILVLAALALVAAASVAAAVGAWLRSQQQDQDLPRAHAVDAFVLDAYLDFAKLPAFRLVVRETTPGDVGDPSNSVVTDTVYSYDGQTLREEYLGGITLSGPSLTASDQHPLSRMFLWADLNCATGWKDVELVDVLGRPTRHVRCVTPEDGRALESDMWIDLETGLPLRSGVPVIGSTGSPVGQNIREVTSLEFGPPDDRLFSAAPGSLPPSSAPVATPLPAPVAGEEPADLTAFVAHVISGYESIAAVEIDSLDAPSSPGNPDSVWRADGAGSFRWDGFLVTGGHFYESWPGNPRGDWRDWGVHGPGLPTFGLGPHCGIGWQYLGDDLVLDRPAAHLVCGLREFWIDREWLLVTRAHDHDPMLGSDPVAGLSRVTSVTFGPQPPELFAPPPADEIWP